MSAQEPPEYTPRNGLLTIPRNATSVNTSRLRLTFGSDGLHGVNLEETDRTANGEEEIVPGDVAKIGLRANFLGYAMHTLYAQAFRIHGTSRTGITRQVVARKVKQLMNEFIAVVNTLRPEFHVGLFGGPEGIQPRDLYLLYLEPVGKRIFDCVLGYYPRRTMIATESSVLSVIHRPLTPSAASMAPTDDTAVPAQRLTHSPIPRDSNSASRRVLPAFSPPSFPLQAENEASANPPSMSLSSVSSHEPPMYHAMPVGQVSPPTVIMDDYCWPWSASSDYQHHIGGSGLHHPTTVIFDNRVTASELPWSADSRSSHRHALHVAEPAFTVISDPGAFHLQYGYASANDQSHHTSWVQGVPTAPMVQTHLPPPTPSLPDPSTETARYCGHTALDNTAVPVYGSPTRPSGAPAVNRVSENHRAALMTNHEPLDVGNAGSSSMVATGSTSTPAAWQYYSGSAGSTNNFENRERRLRRTQ